MCAPPSISFLGSIGVYIPDGMSIGSVAFVGLTVVTDRQRDRPCYVKTIAVRNVQIKIKKKLKNIKNVTKIKKTFVNETKNVTSS